jgi:hypothetical protein
MSEVFVDMCSIRRSADIKTVFDLVPSPLNDVWSYRCDPIP